MRIIGKFSSFVFLVLIAAGAFFLRLEAVNKFPPDFDEDDYLLAAQEIATILKYDYRLLLERNYHPEHSHLAKKIFGVVHLPLTPAGVYPETRIIVPGAGTPLPQPHLTYIRMTNAILNVANVLLISIINPLAGLFLAIDSKTIKYSSQVMLDSFPMYTATLTILFYLNWMEQSKELQLNSDYYQRNQRSQFFRKSS